MYGPPNYMARTARNTELLGVIPRAIHHIFELSQQPGILDFQVHCSFVQIYNENLYDMLRLVHFPFISLLLMLCSLTHTHSLSVSLCLSVSLSVYLCVGMSVCCLPVLLSFSLQLPRSDAAMQTALTIREDANKDIYVQGLSEYNVKGVADTLELLKIAEDNRAIRETHMNQFSSRSHSIFQIFVEHKRVAPDGGEISYKSKVNLSDALACLCFVRLSFDLLFMFVCLFVRLFDYLFDCLGGYLH
jgi:kinesin family member 11